MPYTCSLYFLRFSYSFGRNIRPLLAVVPRVFTVIWGGGCHGCQITQNSKIFSCQRTGQIALRAASQQEQTGAFNPTVNEMHPFLSRLRRKIVFVT